MKFTKVAIKRDNNNWVSLNCDIPYNITNGVETQLQKKTITSYFRKKISVIEDSQIVLSPHPISSSSEALTFQDKQISIIEDSQIVFSPSPHPIPSSSEALTLHEGINYEDIQNLLKVKKNDALYMKVLQTIKLPKKISTAKL
ncbi:unnamed protein product [Gordionus sp. m RMFG-2023]